jgi:ligand-binding sensor domain-containing protein/signal transduction histidine kinase
MLSRQNWLIFGPLLWLALIRHSAASPSYQFDVWQTDEGLPQSTVTSIVQTRDGYLWLGTQNGLVRFDGVRFTVFNGNNTPAIKNDRIAQLFEDHQGTLWVSGEQGEILCLRNGRFTSYEMPGKGTPFNYARRICDDAEGHLWVVSCEWRLIRLEDGRFTVPSTNWNLESVQPATVAADQTGRVWVGTEKELAVWQIGKFQSMWSETNEGNFHVDLATSHTGGVWVATNRRLRKFESGHWVADFGPYAWGNSPIYNLYEDSRSRIWVATMGSGLFRYNPDGTVLHLGKKDGLPTDFVRCVIEDREGNMWIGMESGGLCRLRPKTFISLGVQQGLSSDQVTSVCESTNGSFWIAMDGEGLDHLSSDGKVNHYGSSNGLLNGHVWSVLQDRRGLVWAGTWAGLFRREKDGFADLSDGVNIGWPVFAMYEDHRGSLWLGQQGFGALTRLLGNEHELIRIPGTSSSLDIRVIVQDSTQRLWVGTENEGLYSCANGRWTHYGKKEGLASDTIWSLCAEQDGTLWIGTCGGGLSRWRNSAITTWTTRNGLVNDVICQILHDDKGNLWVGSYNGVFRVNKQQMLQCAADSNMVRCVSYDKTDGLPSLECVGGFQPSSLRSHDGRLWFPTVKGFAIVDPDQIPHNPLPPPVRIDGVVVDGTTVLPRGNAVGPETLDAGVEVPAGSRRLELQYTALSLTAPKKVRFKYKLEGLETGWNDSPTKRSVEYSYIPPGHYTFHVIACNNDEVWNNVGVSLAVTVLPYFWQTGWFMTLVVLTSLGTIGGSVRYVVRRKLQRKIEHIERERAIEAERGRIANDIHDDLGAGLTEIVILGELAQSPEGSPDTVQADIRRVTDKARALAHSLDEIVWAVNPENDMLDSFVSYACNFVHDYLQLARIRCRLDVPSALPDIPLTANSRHNLLMVLKEALNNIVKHADASEVSIQIGVERAKFTVTVADNGKGFNPEPTPGANPGLPAENTAPANRGLHRNGLTNMRKRMQSLNGQFRLQSQPGRGTRVELTVYLRNC